MDCFSYIITRDFGFAPNPFHGYCTLATCKPRIRNQARVGDWIIGFSSNSFVNRRIIYAMSVTEKMDYNSYWEDERFQIKKSNMNGSLIKAYGDNIYHRNAPNSNWIQADSHHSYVDGVTNYNNLNRDTQSKFVLISNNFYYFGKKQVIIPDNINADSLFVKRNHRRIYNTADFMPIVNWIENNFEKNTIYEDPEIFSKGIRYNGLY